MLPTPWALPCPMVGVTRTLVSHTVRSWDRYGEARVPGISLQCCFRCCGLCSRGPLLGDFGRGAGGTEVVLYHALMFRTPPLPARSPTCPHSHSFRGSVSVQVWMPKKGQALRNPFMHFPDLKHARQLLLKWKQAAAIPFSMHQAGLLSSKGYQAGGLGGSQGWQGLYMGEDEENMIAHKRFLCTAAAQAQPFSSDFWTQVFFFFFFFYPFFSVKALSAKLIRLITL